MFLFLFDLVVQKKIEIEIEIESEIEKNNIFSLLPPFSLWLPLLLQSQKKKKLKFSITFSITQINLIHFFNRKKKYSFNF